MRKFILSALLATSSVVATAQPALATNETSANDAKAAADLKNIEKLFATMFDNKDLGPIDPARLALAKQTTAKIMPDGIYSKMMDGLMDKILGSLFAQPGGMSDIEITVSTGAEIPEGGLDEAKRRAVTDLLDPHHEKRRAGLTQMFDPLMAKMTAIIEPPMREGLARAYARKFSAEQLTELNNFLATPTGSFYASESFLLQADPEVMQAVFSALPALMGELTNPSAEMQNTMADIPPARSLADLSTKEMDTLAQLLGTTAAKLNEYSTIDASAAEDAAAAADAAAAGSPDPFAGDNGTEPWWNRENWDPAEQEKIADLESKANALGEQSTAASNAYLDYETEVMLRVRERYLAKGWKPSESSE